MIRVIFELVPHGDESRKKSIGMLEIYNNGSGTKTFGSYGYRLFSRAGWVMKSIPNAISKFPRTRLTVFDLTLRILAHAYWKRNQKALGWITD